MNISERVIALAVGSEARYDERIAIRKKRLQEADMGNIMGADDPERVTKRFANVQAVEERATVKATLPGRLPRQGDADINMLITAIAQERTIGRDDLVAPQFLKLALAASRCVCRITARRPNGTSLGYGTGTLVGPGILLTNHHVLESAEDSAQSEAYLGLKPVKILRLASAFSASNRTGYLLPWRYASPKSLRVSSLNDNRLILAAQTQPKNVAHVAWYPQYAK